MVDNLIDTSTGTFRLKATFNNEDLRLWPGQFVNTRLLLTTRQGAPVVPASAVQRGPEGTFVFAVDDSHKPQRPGPGFGHGGGPGPYGGPPPGSP